MRKSFYFFFNEPKTKIGWVHGILTIVFSTILAYMSSMLFSTFDFQDYAIKIILAMIITPILMSFFGLFLLFSSTLLNMLKKFLLLFLILFILLFLGI